MVFTKLKWSYKIFRSRYFVALTDKDSVIAVKGVKPSKFKDLLSLKAQQGAIREFANKLKDLGKKHDKMVDRLESKSTPKGANVKSVNVRKTAKKQNDTKDKKGKLS